MSRMCALTLLLVTSGTLPAQPKPDDPIKLTVKPAAAPTPSLRYKLLPEFREQTPGNAAQLYYRAFSPEWQTHRRPEQQQPMADWVADMRKMPPDEYKWVIDSRMLRELDRAARRDYCTFEMLPRMQEDGIGTLLPDIQGMRTFANLLAMRARFEIAAGEYDKAVETFKTGFAMARHVAEGGTLIHALVGVAMSTIMLVAVEEEMQTPAAPNLYHALTYLPHPLIDLRKAYEGERIWMDSLFPGMREQLTGTLVPLTDAEAKARCDKVRAALQPFGKSEPSGEKFLEVLQNATKSEKEARKTLLALGHKEAIVNKLPALQAVLLLEIYVFDRYYDDLMRHAQLPYPEAQKSLTDLEADLKKEGVGKELAGVLLPSVGRVQTATTRLERRVAALRIIEAVRLYAAANKGEVPATLDAIKSVPVPLDPATGKAFTYKADGKSFTLTSPELSGQKFHYLVTVKN